MSIMILVTQRIPINSILTTPSGRAEFEFYHIDGEKIIIKTRGGTYIKIPGPCFEELPAFLRKRAWTKIGASHETSRTSIVTVDDFLKSLGHGVSTASYVAAILESWNC